MRSREFLRMVTGIWPQQAGRIIRFPDDRSIGTVYTLSMTEFREGLECWRLLGEARGTLHLLHLPADAVLRLNVNREAHSDPSPLGDLASCDLQWLGFRSWGPSMRTDAALAYIRHLSGLEGLDLANTGLTDAGLAHLRELSGLRYLLIEGNPVTDAGLVHFAGLKKLEYLDLWGSRMKVTDAGLAYLSGLTSMRDLTLWGADITDAGLVHFHRMTALQHLGLSDTRVTEAGREELRRVLPDLKSIR